MQKNLKGTISLLIKNSIGLLLAVAKGEGHSDPCISYGKKGSSGFFSQKESYFLG
jgi:hypothetical protein